MRIIKAADMDARASVQSLLPGGQRRVTPMVLPDPALEALQGLREQVQVLSDELTAKEKELADLRRAVIEASEQGWAQGRAEGLQEAETREGERLRAVEKGLAEASSRLAESLAALEPLALLVARESLDKILGDPGAYPELIIRAVRRQLAGLKEQSVLAVEVSGADFRDSAAISRLATDIERPSTIVEIKEDLASGDCRLRLKLGTVEVGVGRQWDQLGRLLQELAGECSP